MENQRSIGKDFIVPMLIWAMTMISFFNVKNIPFDFSEKDAIVVRYLVKFIVTILFPLLLIQLFYKKKSDFGIYFPVYSDSLKLAFKTFSIAGPACMSFVLIAFLGWEFGDWPGSAILSITFLVVFYFTPRITKNLPTRNSITTPNRGIYLVTLLSLLTLVIAYFTYDYVPVVSKILYYVFIVGFGEELFFRGFLQSSLNRYFSKSFNLGGIKFGWGLLIAAAVFGLSHAIVTVPPTWPWAVWTFIVGLTLGFIREKDGSILAAVMLHAMLDLPLAFMN